ncbi:MAG: MFS transporter [Ignavibacteriaceae bacterium]
MKLKSIISSTAGLILLAYIAFISLGLPDGLLGVAWPSIRTDFSQRLDALGILLAASTAGYLVSSFYSGQVMAWLGVGKLLAASCGITGAALIGYTLMPFWWMLIPLAVAVGLGAGSIDAGLNTYVASNFGEHLMQWLHASFGIGITLGPIIMTTGLYFFSSWRWGYVLVGSAQILLAICFGLTTSMWQKKKKNETDKILTDFKTPVIETLRQFSVWINIIMFFVYTGIEASLGSWAYTLFTESRGISAESAGFWVGSYWASFTAGRITAGFFTKRLGAHLLVKYGLLLAFAGAVLLWWNPVEIFSLIGITITGFAIAPIFPGLVSLTSSRVSPRYAANTIGMQISAAGLGVAVIPGLTGVLAQRISLEVIPIVIIVCIILLLGMYAFSSRR